MAISGSSAVVSETTWNFGRQFRNWRSTRPRSTSARELASLSRGLPAGSTRPTVSGCDGNREEEPVLLVIALKGTLKPDEPPLPPLHSLDAEVSSRGNHRFLTSGNALASAT